MRMGFLDDIVRRTLEDSLKLFEAGTIQEFKEAIATRPPPLSLKQALDSQPGAAIIAEVKRASPSKGEFAMYWDPVELAKIYQANGAAVISVLTERHYFHGDPDFIRRMRPDIRLPILRKDFILEPIQIYESAAIGADALLLIVRLLNVSQLTSLLLLTRSLGMEALVEVHTKGEMEAALHAGATVIGINHRDLDTFEMHMDRAVELAPLAPPDVTLVAASGLQAREDLEPLLAAGIKGFLIGQSLTVEGDPGAKLRTFLRN